MTPFAVMCVGAALNVCFVALLAADKWVHKVTGATPLEGRVTLLENRITKLNADGSEDRGKVQRKIGELELDMREVKTILRLREDTPPERRR